jgi:hypothetical protein
MLHALCIKVGRGLYLQSIHRNRIIAAGAGTKKGPDRERSDPQFSPLTGREVV